MARQFKYHAVDVIMGLGLGYLEKQVDRGFVSFAESLLTLMLTDI